MEERPIPSTTEAYELALATEGTERYILVLYITGATPRSTQAILSIKEICEEHLSGRYELEVIDIYQQPELAKAAQLIAAPTLVKKMPPPWRKLVGSMTEVQSVLAGLGLQPAS